MPCRLALLAPLVTVAMGPGTAHAGAGQCHVVDVELQPNTSDLQIVAWVAKPGPSQLEPGDLVETIFITQTTGTYGLGNRPGRFDFNSVPTHDNWPYGRRITTFPVWAHHNGMSFQQLVFQDGNDNALSHAANQSSHEPHFCRPMSPDEPGFDAGTCASPVLTATDKGKFSSTVTGYPPRNDLTRDPSADDLAVDLFDMLNPYDTVSQATPAGGVPAHLSWPIPKDLTPGDYVLWVEVSRAFDFNATYNSTVYPAPKGIAFGDFGKPYRGQPAVVYQVPFTIGTETTTAGATSYLGYADPTGGDGTVRPADATITTDTPGSGGARLDILAGSSERVHVESRPEMDDILPGAPAQLAPMEITGGSATLQFVAPGDDGQLGKVTGYEVRVRAGSEMTVDNFEDSMRPPATIVPAAPGSTQQLELDNLLPETEYWVGVRAFDECHNTGDIAIVKLTTKQREIGEVAACFVATAAFGSSMANEVVQLRHFRDSLLRQTTLGELAVETYYTFGPAVAGVVGESEWLRAMARDVLAPIVAWTRRLPFQ